MILVFNFRKYIEYFLFVLDVLLELNKYNVNVIVEEIWVYYKLVIFFKDEVVSIEVMLFNCSYKFCFYVWENCYLIKEKFLW